MQALIPSLAGKQSFARAFTSLLLVELVALCGEWIVHQVEYLIVYGSRFQTVMNSTPHRYYMAAVGSLLALGALAALSAWLLMLSSRRRAIGLLRARIPERFYRLIAPASLRLSWRAVLVTGLLLATCQITVYTAQENLEWMSAGLGVPGIWVLIGPAHFTVLPLHAVVALCGSVFLWTLTSVCTRSETILEAIRALAQRFAVQAQIPKRFPAAADRIPHRRLLPTARGLRSPPLAV